MTRRHLLLLALPMALFIPPGCQDEKAPATGERSRPDGGGPVTPDQPVIPPETVAVLVVVPDQVVGEVFSRQQIFANLFTSRGQRLANVPIRFAITSENPGQATLSVEEVVTDAAGQSKVELSLGSRPGELTLQVRADAARAEPIDVRVLVRDRPIGKLEVRFEGVGPARIGPLEVFVMPGTSRCPYNPVVIPFGELAKARVASLEQTTTFEDQRFIANEPVTLYARGMCGNQEMRTIAASGCQDGVLIPAGDTARVTLTMVVRPLNTVGTFDVVGSYDFTDAIPGVAGDVLERLRDFFGGNVARALIDTIQDLIEEFLGGVIAQVINWVVDQVQPLVEGFINEWFAGLAQDWPWLADFMTVGNDLLQVVTNLEILSVIRFDKTGSDFSVAGTEEWTGIALYWRLGCDRDGPPDCGRFEFDMEELLRAERPIEAVFATFNARTNNFNQLRMDPHDVNLQYGRLILFVLNELILPAVADGAHSIAEALINALDCEGLAWNVTGDDGEWEGCFLGICVGFDWDDAYGWCTSAAELVGGLAENLLEPLSFDSVLTLEGDCDLYEDDLDLMVDRLENGHYTGWFHIDGQPEEGSFQATFRGDRRTR
ncbi:MAG: hypothetical protein FJ125_01935 [Deltaproteobacteria bacterium]|nr:hypothetical protein [Deltaproteobacteria bacterium]